MFARDQSPPIRPRRLRSAMVGVAAVALLLPDCGGSSPTVPPAGTTPAPTAAPLTTPPKPTTLADLSAVVTSPQADASLNCTDDVRAHVTVTNRGGTIVTVTGVLDTTGFPAGRCFGGGDYTFVLRTPRTVLPNSTSVVFDEILYTNGPGCCAGTGCGSACTFQEGFEVITDVGNVPAGAFNYKVFFQNCRSCSTTAASAGSAGCARRADLTAR